MEQPRSRDVSLVRRAATTRLDRQIERRARTAHGAPRCDPPGGRRRSGHVRCRCFVAWSPVRHRDHHRAMRIWQTPCGCAALRQAHSYAVDDCHDACRQVSWVTRMRGSMRFSRYAPAKARYIAVWNPW